MPHLEGIPSSPGVYFFKDKEGKIIYVGKASSLRSRVRSYFQKETSLDSKSRVLVKKVADLDYIVTDSEVEALVLESNFIKEYQPRYNVLLKDDKQYPFIKITIEESFPRIFLERKFVQDGSRYFGPYTNVGAVRDTLDLLRKIFPLRFCRQDLRPGKATGRRPCLNYQLGRCLAPCQGAVKTEEYQQVVEKVILFLEGKQDLLLPEFKKKMQQAAAELKFEEASLWRDRCQSIETVLQKQKIVSVDLNDQDVLALVCDDAEKKKALVQVFFIRSGKLVGKEQFSLKNTVNRENDEILKSFMQQFYSRAFYIPREIILSTEPEDKELLEEWLKKLKGKRVFLRIPRRGAKRELVKMAIKNAHFFLAQKEVFNSRQETLNRQGLEELALLLNLDELPHRIEGYDVSTIQGENTVASRVVFIAGKPAKEEYRRYKIQTVTGIDDYAAMREVLKRRFYSPREGEKLFLPNLILIDGGQGHLTAARQAFKEIGIDLPFISLAKKEEIIFRGGGGEPLNLPAVSPALRLLQQVRDEAHRFALSYNRILRKKSIRQGILDDIPGIGHARKKVLLQHFESLEKIKAASLQELLLVKGINKAIAEKIKEHLT